MPHIRFFQLVILQQLPRGESISNQNGQLAHQWFHPALWVEDPSEVEPSWGIPWNLLKPEKTHQSSRSSIVLALFVQQFCITISSNEWNHPRADVRALRYLLLPQASAQPKTQSQRLEYSQTTANISWMPLISNHWRYGLGYWVQTLMMRGRRNPEPNHKESPLRRMFNS